MCYFSAVHGTLFLLVCVSGTGAYLLIFIILCDFSKQRSEAYKLTNMTCLLVSQTIELEKQAKMHLEETLQLSIDEKEEIIKALQTQVDKLV